MRGEGYCHSDYSIYGPDRTVYCVAGISVGTVGQVEEDEGSKTRLQGIGNMFRW